MKDLNERQLAIENERMNFLERRIEHLEDLFEVPSPKLKAEDSLPARLTDALKRVAVLEDIWPKIPIKPKPYENRLGNKIHN